jgi:hypothetical protein
MHKLLLLDESTSSSRKSKALDRYACIPFGALAEDDEEDEEDEEDEGDGVVEDVLDDEDEMESSMSSKR